MADTQPNILVIWGDDIGITNLSCYSDGLMGYHRPNIDRNADEGMRFTDSYGEQSCTAGRAAFITGQSVYRTGLSKVGVPAAPIGLQAEDPTIDDEVLEHGLDFIDRQHAAGTPFFVWFNTTHMHWRTHPKPESIGQAGRWQSPYHDTMIDHDKVVGALLGKLDALGIAENTIVVYSTDNGPHMNTWPDGGMTPFRSEKNTNWEGAFRVPEMVRWPGKIPAGVVSNEIIQHHDWLPTFLAAAGDPDIVEKLKQGHTAGGRTYKVHIDGFNLLPYLTGEVDKSPRQLFIYFSDDGDVLAIRFDNWKAVFMEQRCQGTLQIWAEPFVPLRLPKLFNLRTDPFERADATSNTYWDWVLDSGILVLTGAMVVGQFLQTFKEFPPRQHAASFTIDQAVAKLEASLTQGQ